MPKNDNASMLASTVGRMSQLAVLLTSDAGEAGAMMLSAMSAPLGILATLTAPSPKITEDSVLFSALVAAKALHYVGGGNKAVDAGISLNAATYKEAMEDFQKLRPGVDVSKVLNPRVIEYAAKANEPAAVGIAMLEKLIAEAKPGEPNRIILQ